MTCASSFLRIDWLAPGATRHHERQRQATEQRMSHTMPNDQPAESTEPDWARRLRRQSRIALVVASVALVAGPGLGFVAAQQLQEVGPPGVGEPSEPGGPMGIPAPHGESISDTELQTAVEDGTSQLA